MAVRVGVRHDRQAQRAAHRAAQRLPAERIGRAAGDDDAGRAAGLGDAHDRADVAGILHVDGDDDQRSARPEKVRVGRGGRAASATMGLDDRTGLSAAMTADVADITSTPAS